jgi:hypothetical protein
VIAIFPKTDSGLKATRRRSFRLLSDGPSGYPIPGFFQRDLHHVLTGCGTGLLGEAQISAYELHGGCGSFMILSFASEPSFSECWSRLNVSGERGRVTWRK